MTIAAAKREREAALTQDKGDIIMLEVITSSIIIKDREETSIEGAEAEATITITGVEISMVTIELQNSRMGIAVEIMKESMTH